ncbi:DUF7681 family protein [Vreelandella venusta]|uniref:Acb2/Tad1 domain-containing protein n=1 Tax=Vreelandella venusta TaxID=44935 RepID=UPI001168B6FA|nr:hypothetical protein [Halomonas venusta]GEK52357.1 hypothetical protein HVE01_30780 [Halomonas venusta]
MKDQHTKISGYRDLTQAEIDLMNEGKRLEAQCLAYHDKVKAALIMAGYEPEEAARTDNAQALRWLSIGRTNVEQGFMALIRAVAQPQPIVNL